MGFLCVIILSPSIMLLQSTMYRVSQTFVRYTTRVLANTGTKMNEELLEARFQSSYEYHLIFELLWKLHGISFFFHTSSITSDKSQVKGQLKR